jgi:diguanylate cyclase (GGDEF)-like protein/PAS domain S-box-containing protein
MLSDDLGQAGAVSRKSRPDPADAKGVHPSLGLRTRLATLLPAGTMLPFDAWLPRHRWIVRLLWLHVPALFLFGILRTNGIVHATVEVVPLIVLAIAAEQRQFGQQLRSCLAGAGLMAASAVLVHLGDGRIEMHFHFFVMLPVIATYQEWRPFLMSIGFVALHHGTVGIISPGSVFDHESATENPVLWAGIHAAFVLAASSVCLLSWRLIEDSNRSARRQLEDSERLFRSIIENAHDVVLLVDVDSTILYESPAGERLLGYPPGGRIGMNGLSSVHPDDLARATEVLGRVAEEGGSASNVEVRIQHHDGHYLWVECSVANLVDVPGVNAFVVNFRDVDERHALEDALAHQAFHDSLTGLANRALLLDRVEHALATAARSDGTQVALLYLDLDDFKLVNDGLGHHAGDELLRRTATRINECLRHGDTASRLGGDEFAVLLPDVVDPEGAHEVGARLLEAVRAPHVLDGRVIACDASLGIVVCDSSEVAADLLRNADVAMYRAKSLGKGRLEVYEASMHASVVERLALIAELGHAVDNQEIEPHYQAIVDLATGAIVGVEALARWNHPARGFVPPIEFIPLAEETGLIVPLGMHLLRRACSDAARWRRELGERAPKGVSVNISAVQLQTPEIVAEIDAVLHETNLPPSALLLEITESVFLDDTGAVRATLAAINALGVRIALDDFGTGYSSLSYLHSFPVDVVKIDKSFIDALAEPDPDAVTSPLVGAIVNLTLELGLTVEAEGIEDALQVTRLRALGCHYGQGYYFGRPMPAAELERVLGQPLSLGT